MRKFLGTLLIIAICLAATLLLIPLATLERGYPAIGGEWAPVFLVPFLVALFLTKRGDKHDD